MSVRSRINELIDSKNLEDAQKTIELRSSDITTSDLQSIYYLINKLIENKQPSSAICVLQYLSRSPVFLSASDFSSLLKGLLRVGTIEHSKHLLLSFIEQKIITDTQTPLVFIESACEKREFDAAYELICLLSSLKVPTNERFWESTLQHFTNKDAVVHSSYCLKLLTLPALKSKRIWSEFITSCLRTHNFLLAMSTVEEIALVSDKSLGHEWWNLLLQKIVEDSEMPCFEICKIFDRVVELGVRINADALTLGMGRLVVGEEERRVVGYLKALKSSVSSFVMSRIITKLIDMNIPREALELSNLVVQEVFGPQVTVDNLEISNDKLKWILKHQQLQMIKFMKISRNVEEKKEAGGEAEELEDDEFVFL